MLGRPERGPLLRRRGRRLLLLQLRLLNRRATGLLLRRQRLRWRQLQPLTESCFLSSSASSKSSLGVCPGFDRGGHQAAAPGLRVNSRFVQAGGVVEVGGGVHGVDGLRVKLKN